MARIGIDARLIRAYGIGSYIRGLLGGLAGLTGDERYVVFAAEDARELVPPSFEVVLTEVRPHSVDEFLRMARLIDRVRLDLVHVPHFNLPWTDRPIVATMYDAIPFHFKLKNPIAFAYITLMMQTTAQRARRILAISHSAKRDVVEAVDCDPDRIEVVHIGVDDAFFHPEGPQETRWSPYFLFVGRVAPHKNIEVLLDALSIVRRSEPSVKVVLAGGKHASRDVEGVVVPGYVPFDELQAIYRGAIAVVMPSFMEGFGLPPLEGMAIGTPAITSNAPALVEVTGGAALHFDPRSPEQLAAAMLRLVRDPALRADLTTRGLARAGAFRWAACAEHTRRVYRQVLSATS